MSPKHIFQILTGLAMGCWLGGCETANAHDSTELRDSGTFPPLTPGLSPLRGEGERIAALALKSRRSETEVRPARSLRIVHLGDNGPLRDDIVQQLGRVDVLMMPIDSQFHILKADEIAAIRRRLSPSILIPMHYRHDDLEAVPGKPEALGGIEGWAKGEANVRYLDTHTNEFCVESLPRKPEVIIFKHSPLVKAPLKTNERQ